jgi:hypothetical protein
VNILSDPAHAHPTWCDRSQCTHPDALAARGVAEADVPLHLSSSHLSTPVVLGDSRHGDPVFVLQADRQVDAPVTDEVEAVDFTLRIPERGFTVTVMVDPPLLDRLAGAIEHMRLLALGTSPTLVDRAIRALRDFGVYDREAAHRLLPDWHAADQLDDGEYEQIIGAFPPAPVYDGPREIPWPAELDPARREDER